MRAIALLAGVLISPAAMCQVSFLSYAGPTSVWPASNGFKQTKSSFDFWMDGKPSVNYTVVGVVKDQRARDYPWAPKQVSFNAVARVARTGGADAVILLPDDVKQVNTTPPLPVSQPKTWEDALRERGMVAQGGNMHLGGELPNSMKNELDRTNVIDLGAAACGESRFLAVRYVGGSRH